VWLPVSPALACPPMVIHGALVLNAKTGTLQYSTRLTPLFGLAGSDLGRDELRLGAMLYALHLNAAHCALGAPADGGLRLYQIGGVAVHFHSSDQLDLLFVLFAPSSAGQASTFVASELARNVESACCAAEPQPADAMSAPSPRPVIKRSQFASALRKALRALPDWIIDQMMLADAAYSGTELRLEGLAALHSSAICRALEQTTPLGSTGHHSSASSVHPSSSRARASPTSRALQPSLSGVSSPPLPPEPPPSSSPSSTMLSLDALVGLPPSGTSCSSPPTSHQRRPGCFGCCLPCHRAKQRGTARRPAPHPPPAPQAAPPQLYWREPEADERVAASAPSVRTPSFLEAVTPALKTERPQLPGSGLQSSWLLQQLVRELHAAARHGVLPAAHALYSEPSDGRPSANVGTAGGIIGGGRDRSPIGGSAVHQPSPSYSVVFVRSPLLLRARVVQQEAHTSTAHAATPPPRLPASSHATAPSLSTPSTPADLAAIVTSTSAIASLAVSLHPWVEPLALALSALEAQPSISTGRAAETQPAAESAAARTPTR